MDSKRKLVVLSLDIDTLPIIRYHDMLQDYSLHGVSAPTGLGYTGRDIGSIDGGNETGFCFTDDFEGLLDECDSVLFSGTTYDRRLEKYILTQISKAAARGKEILLTMSLEDVKKKQIEEIINDRCCLRYIEDIEDRTEVPEYVPVELSNISTPVIMVAGLGERCNKFETQLSLRRYFTSMDYKVCQLGTKNYCSLFGFKSLPGFLFENVYTPEQKIYLFNDYLLRIEKEEKPDVFIIGVPGGIMTFDNLAVNHFAILPYILSNAVRPDAMVLNIYYNSYDDKSLQDLKNYCWYRFGFEIDAFNVANTKYDINMEDKVNHVAFLSLDSYFVMGNLTVEMQEKWKIYNVLSKASDRLPEHVYNVLAGNVSMLKYE